MKRRSFRFPAEISLRVAVSLAAVLVALAIPAARLSASRRPHYGGTLRVEIGATVSSLDPGATGASLEENEARRQIEAFIYEKRGADGTASGVAGSGPFRISEWQPGKHLTLAANDDFSGGRPFVDAVEIEMGRSTRDRLTDLQLDRADLTDIPAEQARLESARGVRISASQPDQLIALVFPPEDSSVDDARLRQAVALSIDRTAIVDFILQREGEPAGGLLPQWLSGTAFLFPAVADSARAKELRAQIGASPQIRLGYDASDTVEESLAERIAVNARDAGIGVTVRAAESKASEDARLMRLPMSSPHPAAALASLLATLNPVVRMSVNLPRDAEPEQIYTAERNALDGYRIVPLVWVPRVYGLSERVRDWQAPATGESWPVADVWLDSQTSAMGAPGASGVFGALGGRQN